MWAELVVEHDPSGPDAELELLVSVFDAHDASALANSVQFSEASWKDHVLYARELASYRLICYRDGNDELVSYIEVKRGTILDACESVWRKLKHALAALHPKIGSLDLVDSATGSFLSGQSVALGIELKKRETLVPLTVGLATLIYFAVAAFTFGRADRGKYAQGE